jgi:RNA polymerase sigma-70 factor (ECF subfamily)
MPGGAPLIIEIDASSSYAGNIFWPIASTRLTMSKNSSAIKAPIDNPENWVDEYGDFLYRYALSRVKDPTIAEDLVQETFLAALKARQNFQGRSTARTWMIAILKHKIVDYIRKKVREPASDKVESLSDAAVNDSVDGSFASDGEWKNRPAEWAVNPTKLYEQKEFFDILYRCLGELPGRQAKAFMMREIDGLSTDEICKALGISATNSWVILYRARMLLRQCLEINWLSTDN